MKSDIAISVSNLSKKYRIGKKPKYQTFRDLLSGIRYLPAQLLQNNQTDFWALKDVSFEVKEGEVMGIIGKNGSGKSTLLKILSQITQPTTGKVILKGRVASLLEVGTGFNQDLTGRENIYLNGSILGMTRREINTRFDEIVDFSGVENFLDTPVKRYSSGMYVRLAFAVAAHLESEILLVDEVLAVGDAEFQKKCLGKMNNLAKSGKTVLFVSHNMGIIQHLCKKAVFINNGNLISMGRTSTIISKYLDYNKSDSNDLIVNLTHISRPNNTQAILQEAWIENKNGKIVNELTMGNTFKLCVSWKSQNTISHPCFEFSIFNTLGSKILSYATYLNSNKVNKPMSHGIFEFNLDDLKLLPGKYYFNFGIAEGKDQNLDSLEACLSLTITSYDYFKTGKLYDSSHGMIFIEPKYFIRTI